MSATWPEVPLNQLVAEFFDGPHATPPPAESGPIFLGIQNITEDGFLDLRSVRHIAEEDFPTWTRRVEPRPGDLVLTYEASLHRYAVIPRGFRGCLGRRVALIRPRLELADTKFLLYTFIGPEWRRTVQQRLNVGSTVDRLPLTDLPNFPIRMPPLTTQHKIAAVLSAYDDLIENSRHRISALEEMARRIYHEWFVALRPRGQQERGANPGDGGLPNGWRMGALKDLVEINATTIKRIDPNERIRYVDISSVTEGVVQEPKELGLGDAPGRARRRVVDGDILWSTVRPNLRSYALMLNPGSDCVASTGFAVLSPRQASFAYLYCLVTTDEFVEYLTQRASGSAYPAVTPPVFLEAPALIPPTDVAAAFAEIAEPLLRLVSRLRVQTNTLAAARSVLLPRLISGELDVSELDIATPPVMAK